MCDRHEGVGADGVEWMCPHASADVEIRLINADGSEAEISGNGTRCVAAYVCMERAKEKDHDPDRGRNENLRADGTKRVRVRV